MSAGAVAAKPLTAFLIAGEESGDALGAGLMAALARKCDGAVRFAGIGGDGMARCGLTSLFPMEELSLHGLTEVIGRVPGLIRRIDQTVAAVLAANPDVLVAIDCPAFSLRVAKRVRRLRPDIAIVDYVSPSVWAYWSWRARAMARFVDRVLAILPFEPEAHRRLGGPPCTYVGHPLITRLDVLRPAPGERPNPASGATPVLLVMPGSRRSEVSRLMKPFGEAVGRIVERVGPLDVVLPAVPRRVAEIRAAAESWPVKPRIVEGEAAKLAAFRSARAALVASGTTTLELALSAVPMAVAYRVDPLIRPFKRFLRAKSIVLANLVLDARVIPEFIDADTTPEKLANAVVPLVGETLERAAQMAAFARLDALMEAGGVSPSERAADAVLETVASRKR